MTKLYVQDYVHTSLDDRGIATVFMTRAEVHNAFDDKMIEQLIAALAMLKDDTRVRAVILRSHGPNFSAGADLNWMKAMAGKGYKENLTDAAVLAQLMDDLDKFPKPTVVLVQGGAFGGAVGLVACCDIALVTPHTHFCLSEVKIGLIPAVISPYVVAAIGERQARRYFLTAERIDAEQALALGFVHQICDDFEEDLTPILDALLTNSPAAMRSAKAIIQLVSNETITPSLVDETLHQIAEIRVSSEGQEGIIAFLEKRKPNWIKE